ncbi:MAG: sel1 repeat family protein [Deltaproteobacteria bacterium]|nr:sel1 repeat family protein [Deltaproteobacteria bacterium]
MKRLHLPALCFALFGIGCGSAPPPMEPEPPPLATDDEAADETTAEEPDALIEAPCETADDCNNKGAMALLAGQFDQALPMLEKGCQLASAAACSNLGGAHLRGDGGQPDISRAREFLVRSCELGSDSGCTDAGVIYHRGDGVPRDEKRAFELFELGCERGDEQACFNCGLLLVDGTDVPRDKARAVTLFGKACDAGHAEGCSNAGIMLYKGKGLSQDYAGAVPFFEKACERDVTDACFNLGVAYLKGHGVTEDSTRSAELFDKACKLGDKDGCDIQSQFEQEAAGGSAEPSTSLGASSMTVNGMTVSDLACDLTGGGFLGTMTIIGGLAERKKALDRCAPKGDTPTVTWTMKNGKTSQVEVTGAATKKIAKCVKKAMKKMRSAIDGKCSGIIHLGK